MAQFIPQSPFVAKLGIVAEQLDGDQARLRPPWDASNVTVDDMVQRGAIAALADVAVMAAAWSRATVPLAGVERAQSGAISRRVVRRHARSRHKGVTG